MGSDKRSSRRKDKEKRKKRSRTPSSDSQSQRSDRSDRRRSKKIKKKSSSNKRQSRQVHGMFPPPPSMGFFSPFMPAPPPPPTPSVVVPATTKSAKSKQQSNIFKILPQLGWSSIMFCNTIIDPQLFGLQNYDQMINKMWKKLERKIKSLNLSGTDRLLKRIIPQGIARHDKIVEKIKQNIQKKQKQMVEEPRLKYSDFEILKAYYEKKPEHEIKKMIGPQNTVKLFSK